MEGLSQNEKIIWCSWNEKSPRDVVREAAAKGTHINLALKYLMDKNSWSESTAQDWFLAEVKAWTVQLLMRKQIYKVLHVLTKAKINPEEHLMTLAQESPDIEYRNFIVEQLEKTSKDIKTENLKRWHDFKMHWNLLRYLEKSFEVDGKFKQNKVFGMENNRIVVNESEIKALTIEGIQKYSPEWKSRIATALFFDTFDFSLLDFSTPMEVWNYLIEQNKAMILVRWINIQTSEVVRDMNARYNFFNKECFWKKILNVDTKGFDSKVLDSLDELFRKWPITQSMIASVAKSKCFGYTKMCIYDTLCSYGIVNEDERDNLNQIIARLARTQNLKLIDDVFTESCATISKQHFYVELAKYCVKNRLYNVLTICVECNILNTDLSEVEKSAKDCIEMWLLFKSIEQTSDRQSHVVPVYKTCEQIAGNDISNYISSNPELVLGMILLEDNAKLFDIFTTNDYLEFQDFKLPNKGYKNELPHLFNINKRFHDTNQNYENKDVNVYQLLAGYRGLDVSKIFEFQLLKQNTNNLNGKPDRRSLSSLLPSDELTHAGLNTIQKSADMPDFANAKLMKRYGYVAKLNHVYYLKQYRPCNASQAFVAHQYSTFNRLQDKSIKSACCEAHALALQNWSDPAMTACAVSFIAMIGCNPTRCRVHISAAKMMKYYMLNVERVSDDEVNKIINDYMCKLIQCNDEAAREILQYIEKITMQRYKEKFRTVANIDMSWVLYESQTMVKFAMLHNLPLPEMLLRDFVKRNSWFNFMLFGDVFRYPMAQMLELSQEFETKSFAEHLKHIILHRSNEEGQEAGSNNGQRRYSRFSSVESSQSSNLELSSASLSRELWEVTAACHGPEDPPSLLLRAAEVYREPLLVLIASCYEPNAVDLLWSQWILASLPESIQIPSPPQWESGHLTTEQFQQVAELCLSKGYVATLHESMLIFIPESPLTQLTSFLYRTIRHKIFDSETSKLLSTFLQQCQRKYSNDSNGQSMHMSKETLLKIAVSLIKITVIKGFDSAYHQREFLGCLVAIEFGKGLTVPSPNFANIYEILKISMDASFILDVAKILLEDVPDYLPHCIQLYTENKEFDVALKIAKLANLPVDDGLTSEWNYNFEQLRVKDGVDDTDLAQLLAKCSEAFKKATLTIKVATQFLVGYVGHINKSVQRFYCYRIIMSWFQENLEYGEWREKVEHLMWDAYFQSALQGVYIFLNSHQSTLHYLLNGQKDPNLAIRIGQVDTEKPFSLLLSEIEIESDVGNIDNVVSIDDLEVVDIWRKVIGQLLELRLLVDAFRLSALFCTSAQPRSKVPCPVKTFRTCLKLAEGSCSPYDIPHELRLVMSSALQQSKLSISEASDASFEELVVIPDKQENITEGVSHLAVREEADRLASLDSLAAKTGLGITKQVASYFRIALQIGWEYVAVLKYQSHCLNFINLVSGRARMSLANLVFRTYNVPSKQVAEYLCREMVAATISPHLVKTSTFRQKEHFQYTLWGYVLSSDLEMFLNMRPDACTHIGRLVLDHLVAFQRIYKVATKVPEDTLDDAALDVDTLIDEEYQNVEERDVESVVTEDGTLMSADTESLASMSTVFTLGNKSSRETRRNLFDLITRSNVHIRYEVKSNIRKITKGAKLSTKQVNIICIELLYIAHGCFSCACDTEGIGVVLRSAAALTSRLLAARSWRLMVRLLTSLGRYAECTHILHALRDNHQFEFLLGQFDFMIGQQPEKIAEFKQGLLDYLKTHCPGDTDTYIMVALHFNMYSEAANVKRKQALSLIKDLEKMAVDATKTNKRPQQPVWYQIHDNTSTRSLLETALNHCTDAAELYLQGGCTGAAGEMAALAQLIALQMSLLNASPTRLILNRSTEQMYKLVSEYLSFMEGLILLSSRGGEAWRELAYRRALSNDQVYLRDMAACRPDVAKLVLERYQNEKNKTASSQAAMTELRNLCR